MTAAEGDIHVTAPPEPDLAARVALGDRHAEREFVTRFERGIRVLVRRHCRPGEPMIDDLVQDVIEQVLKKLRAGELRDGEALPAYVRSTVVYMTASEYRRRARRAETQQTLVDVEEAYGPDVVDEDLDAIQLRRLIRDLLTELPVARDRAILDCFYLREQGKDEVCATLGIDELHFHRVISRARQRFGTLLRSAGIYTAPR
jgi:RNA polymerase sigma-70 factor (ECF subfamily)